MNIKKIVGILVIIGFVSFPLIVDYYISKTIDNTKNNLLTNGIELNVKKEFGVLSSKRDIELTVKDSNKFFIALLSKFNGKYLLKKQLTNFFSPSKLDKFFKNIKFTGNIITNNYVPNNYAINLTLKQLSTKFMNEIYKNKDLKFILNLLEKEAIKFSILINTNNKDNYTIILKDINEEIKTKEGKLFVTLEDNKLLKKDNKYIYTVKKQIFKINDKYTNIFLNMNNFKETYSYNDSFNQFIDISFNDYESFINKLNIKASKFYLKTKNNSDDKIVNSYFRLNIDDFFLINKQINTSFDKLELDINSNNINKKGIKSLLDKMQNLTNYGVFFPKNEFSMSLLNILNKGFDTQIKLDLKNFNMLHQILKNLKLKIDVKLNKNQITMISLPSEVLKIFDITSEIIIDKEFLENPFIQMSLGKIISYGIVKNSSVWFNIIYKDSILIINNKKVKL